MRYLIGVAGAVIAFSTVQSFAQDIAECAAINSELDRLACYDKASGRTPDVVLKAGSHKNWTVREETSKITDQANVFLNTLSKEVFACDRYTDEKARLVVRCMENTTAIMISSNCHLTSSDYSSYGHVDVRLDSDKSKTVRMQESTSSDTLGLWSGGRSIPFIKGMFGKRKMLARVTPYGQSASILEFDITGIEDEIAPLRKACGW